MCSSRMKRQKLAKVRGPIGPHAFKLGGELRPTPRPRAPDPVAFRTTQQEDRAMMESAED